MDMRQIEEASRRLREVIHPNETAINHTFSEMMDSEVYLKCENLQKTGSFKVRGAYNKLAVLKEEGSTPAAVVASSAGNHAQGVAFAATSQGIPSTIIMPRSAPIAKVLATENYGAKVVLHGDYYDDAYARAMEICEEEKAVFVHPFNDEDIIAGQGTVGLEILRDVPNVDIVIVPAGGGGLLSGVAYCIKNINPRVQVIGVQAEGADAIVESFYSPEKALIESENVHTIADGIAVKAPGDITVSLIREYVDQMVTVSDEDIASTILLLMERCKMVVEPAGAASLAAVLNNRIDVKGKRVACVLSGGNIDVSFIHRIIEKGLVTRGRQIKLRSVLTDAPGSLEKYAHLVSSCGANIIKVQYDRVDASLRMDQVILEVTCEVSGPEQGHEVIRCLKEHGFPTRLES